MTETAAYKEWLVGGRTDKAVVETIQVSHVSFPTVYLANWDAAIQRTVVDQGNVLQEFLPTRFELVPPQLESGTLQAATLSISAFDGLIYSAVKAMTVEERRTKPIEITPRIFFHNEDAQLITNPPVWHVHNLTLSLEAVSVQLAALPLRIHRTGIYYTALNFPVLRYYA